MRQSTYPGPDLDCTIRTNIKPAIMVDIILKRDQPTGRRTRGLVADILTRSPNHPRGIKVRLTDGRVGRVQHIVPTAEYLQEVSQ